jgi:hypothetical protein
MESSFIQFGFDPGAKGGWAALSPEAKVLGCGCLFPFEIAHASISIILDSARRQGIPVFGTFEDNHAHAHDSKRSIRSFGSNTGETIGLLKSLNFWPVEMVSPQKWQHRMRCQTGGNKRITWDKASLLFQDAKITHYVADALLIAEDARRRRCLNIEFNPRVATAGQG